MDATDFKKVYDFIKKMEEFGMNKQAIFTDPVLQAEYILYKEERDNGSH